MVVGFAADAVGELPDQERDGEADAGDEAHVEHDNPPQVRVKRHSGSRVSSKVLPTMPIALPRTRPAMMPTAIASWNDSRRPEIPPTVTPAEKNAKTGTANAVDGTLHRSAKWAARPSYSGRPSSSTPICTRARFVAMTGTVKPRRTPATVAWTPEACTNAHVATPSGIRIHQERLWVSPRVRCVRFVGNFSDYQLTNVQSPSARDRPIFTPPAWGQRCGE